MTRAFLWNNSLQRPTEAAFRPASGKWWDQFYAIQIQRNDLSDAALRELDRTSRDVAGLVPRPGTITSSPNKGVVVGAVQSGKTQSMMGVAATCMDNGYRVVIVLAGLKEDLRAQTARRVNSDLLQQNDNIPGLIGATTLGGAIGPRGRARAYAPPYHVDCHEYGPLAPQMSRALNAGLPCVVVVKKNQASLSDLSMVMGAIYSEFGAAHVPVLVLDDECDEATVPGGIHEKAIPESILRLWAGQPDAQVSYIGYTATAAANLLQHPDWALYPDWVYLLRYPGGLDGPIEYHESVSDSWYSGSDCFYSALGDEPGDQENFLVAPSVTQEELDGPASANESLKDALRAFFVSGAVRLTLTPDRSFDDLNRLPHPHSMMIHTSAAQDDHAKWARAIAELFDGQVTSGEVSFSDVRLSAILDQEEDRWREWHIRFGQSRERIYVERPHVRMGPYPTWDQVKAKLPEVFKNTRMKVVNSDDASSSLDYRPPLGGDGRPVRRPDVYLIAVGGSRLSRGITVEGLCISYFARWARVRHDDTILQMSRWFGYRGRHLEFCRLFTSPSAYLGLRETGENDLQLRLQLATLMADKRSPREATLALAASPFSAPTAKIGAGIVQNLTFSPFTRVLARVECDRLQAANEAFALELAGRIRARGGSIVTRESGTPRGTVSPGWTLQEVADLLDRWQFSHHNPDPSSSLLAEYFRPVNSQRPKNNAFEPSHDPYHIAAYLRFWADACAADNKMAPSFNVGVGYGEMDTGRAPFDFPLLNRQVTDDNFAVGGWTGSSSNWRGDIVFDNPKPEQLDERGNRLAGACGLLLMYVINKNAIGKNGRGKPRDFHTPFFGLAVPAGGPNFMRILTATGAPLVRH